MMLKPNQYYDVGTGADPSGNREFRAQSVYSEGFLQISLPTGPGRQLETPPIAHFHRVRARPLTLQKIFFLANQMRPIDRVLAAQKAYRNEARMIWSRLALQHPTDPFSPEEGFSTESARLKYGEFATST